jgi:hypothetical protein
MRNADDDYSYSGIYKLEDDNTMYITTIVSRAGCFPYFFTRSFINVSAIGLFSHSKGKYEYLIELLYLLNQ